MDRLPQDAVVPGTRMEGSYLSARRKGAQRDDALRSPDFTEFLRLYHGCGSAIHLVNVVPECKNAYDLITQASEFCMVSVAHSETGYDTTMQGFQWGIAYTTYLFNVMTGLHHRQPRIAGVMFGSADARAELICDGLHIHPVVLRTAFCLPGGKRNIIVNDSVRVMGLPDRESELGG